MLSSQLNSLLKFRFLTIFLVNFRGENDIWFNNRLHIQIGSGKIYLHKKFQINISKNNWITVFYDKDVSTDHKICEYCFLNISASSHPLQPRFSGNDLQHIKKWPANTIDIWMSSSNIKSLSISQHLAIQRSWNFQETTFCIFNKDEYRLQMCRY